MIPLKAGKLVINNLIIIVKKTIDDVFNNPLVSNFNTRQEQLADQLDVVRTELYDVKMDSNIIKLFTSK